MGYVRILLAHLKPVLEILAVKTGECVNVCTYVRIGKSALIPNAGITKKARWLACVLVAEQ